MRWHIRYKKYPRSRRIRETIIAAETQDQALKIFEEYNQNYMPCATLVSVFEFQPRRDVIGSGTS